MRLWLRVTALAVGLGLALLLGVGSASAHSYLVSSDPADGASLDSGPAQVTLSFNEQLQTSFDSLSVVGPDGNLWSTGDTMVNGAKVSIALTELGPVGKYTVAYRVVSADSHPVAGTTSFTLTRPGKGTPGPKAGAQQSANSPSSSPNSDSGGGPPAWIFIVVAGVVVVVVISAVAYSNRRKQQ